MSSNAHLSSGLQPERLRLAREKRGISQRELGRILGLGANQINRYEVGTTDPSTPILSALSRELRVTADYLLGLSDDDERYTDVNLPDNERKLLEAYSVGDVATLVKLATDRLRLLEGEKS